jgi:prolyl oligopeptidase
VRATSGIGWWSRATGLGLVVMACATTPASPGARPTPSGAAPRASAGATLHAGASRLAYPASHRGAVVETLHGVPVADPYRWLEASNRDETRAWIASQNQLTRAFLSRIPERAQIRRRLRELWEFERYDLPTERGGRYFYRYNPGLLNQSVLYWLDGLSSEPKVLLDPNPSSSDGTLALKGFVPSEDGRLVAYGLSRAGSDWTEWRVRRVDDGTDLPDLVEWTKFSSVAWRKDGSGFYYSRYAAPAPGARLEESNYYNKLYYHRLGTKQADDKLIYERADQKKQSFEPTVTRDGRYLLIEAHEGTDAKNAVLYVDLAKPKAAPVELVPSLTHEHTFIGSRGSKLWFKTDLHAPRGRVVSVDVGKPAPRFEEVIAEMPETLQQVELLGDKLVANYLKHAFTELRVLDPGGALERVLPLPGLGTAWLSEGDPRGRELFISYESFFEPRQQLRFDAATQTNESFRKPSLKLDPAGFETRQVFYASKDGTRVSMFLTHKKGLPLGDQTPCLLYGYGGFNIAITPTFRPAQLAWLELGGLLAVPNLRGGGEYGEEWHEAGKKSKKQNVFDDFIAAAEYLQRERVTSRDKLAIGGRSNGGLLVGAMLAQRPELFGAALPAVGVYDMLRFHKFTIGWSWVDDYGSPDDAADFKSLLAYSPLHNLRPGLSYPATLLTTADHDDRVVPAHSFKFAAALQHAQAGPAPILIRIETRAGHGEGIPTDKRIDEAADQWAFLVKALDMSPPASPQ